MVDVFTKSHARELLKEKFVLMMGDSNMRSLYKDLVYLMKNGGMTPDWAFRRGTEKSSLFGDTLLSMASHDKAGRNYYETREYRDGEVWVRFVFVTQVRSPWALHELSLVKDGSMPPPDILLLNSCLWDLTRWGAKHEDQYKRDMVDLFIQLHNLLPHDSLVIWPSTLPVATERVKGGVFIKQLEFVKHSMRFMVMEANTFAQNLCKAFNFNFLDQHYYMQFQLNRRTNDGLHWDPPAMRYISNLVLTHIALALDKPLPGNISDDYQLHTHAWARERAWRLVRDEFHLDEDIRRYLRAKLGEEEVEVAKKTRGESTCHHQRKDTSARVKYQAKRPSKQAQNKGATRPSREQGSRNRPTTDRRARWARAGTSELPSLFSDVSGSQFFTGGGQVGGAAGGVGLGFPLGIENSFNNMVIRNQGNYSQYDRSFSGGYGQPHFQYDYQHQPYTFHSSPVQFWKDYPVANFPWNQ